MNDMEERFWLKVDKRGANDCWEWQAGKDWDGYGIFSIHGKSPKAHRIAWELSNGCTIPEGLVMMHTCDNPSCCNPAHLALGTNADNIHDAQEKGRLRGPRGEKQWHSKLTVENVREIRRLYATGEYTHETLATMFDVGRRAIGRVISGVNWGWLDAA